MADSNPTPPAAADDDAARPLGLFEGYGIELEYMIVDRDSLDVAPIADRLIELESGAIENEIERGAFAWSNELARHVIEMKTNGPVARLDGLAAGFQAEVRCMNDRLATLDARLLPGAMHPWMDAARDFELWPHGSREIYACFDRIFDCRGHGWANLQSAHLNLSFADDDEFGRLHAAARAILPLLPALAAASPCLDGTLSGVLDRRLEVYGTNARRVPSVSGSTVPEAVFTRNDYEGLLEGIYHDLAPLDPEGILRHEWVNARGCIARFDRMAIEIRVLDVQECPAVDIAIAAAVSASVRALCEAGPAQSARLRALDTERLAASFRAVSRTGEGTWIDDRDHLAALGFDARPRTAAEVWDELIERDFAGAAEFGTMRPVLEVLRDEGTLASRLVRRLRAAEGVDAPIRDGSGVPAAWHPSRESLQRVWGELADCLRDGRMLRAPL